MAAVSTSALLECIPVLPQDPLTSQAALHSVPLTPDSAFEHSACPFSWLVSLTMVSPRLIHAVTWAGISLHFRDRLHSSDSPMGRREPRFHSRALGNNALTTQVYRCGACENLRLRSIEAHVRLSGPGGHPTVLAQLPLLFQAVRLTAERWHHPLPPKQPQASCVTSS